ncbi:Dual specificity protein kinase TTK [Colletotrichum musicola]|uniref:Dual specificity protein kinase TTK n=1 Tax=Colletotrichum musicola TaxID=2175873 RepID=A0A8H6J029_9PEZI|nr:Dual specificity protein kinase TTK [Colletotrichum musicola]
MSLDHQEITRQFDLALREFRNIRKQETRTSACGQEFVLVNNVTARVKRPSPKCPRNMECADLLEWLGKIAYRQQDGFGPPQMKRSHYNDCLSVFYTLLDIGAPSAIHLFKDLGLKTLPIERSVLERNIAPPPGFADFHDRFYRQQFAWCPIPFELGMGQIYRDSISPFSRKEKITPYRDGKGPKENTAALYAIDVPEEMVGLKLQMLMASARIKREEKVPEGSLSKGYRYRFALKQFMPHKSEHFTNEKHIFSNLEHKEGMIRYIGWFKSFELVENAGMQEYYNIVLELAEFDFYEAILQESPPISFDEIQGFWESMYEISRTLASFHTVVVDGDEYLTWHGDIKPENILRVNGQFKLADPGEASMLLKSCSTSGIPNSKSMGGTRTYAAPEKAAYLDGRSDTRSCVTPESDVWSFGCVLSIAATYVVLGKQGFLIYNELRRQAIYNSQRLMSDVFHDGEYVLPEISDWHVYIREAARKTDTFTATILDMVDNHMLVARESRWGAKAVCQEFRRILGSHGALETQVPRELQNLLQNIDLKVERDYDQHSGFKRVEVDDATKRLIALSLPPAEVEFESRQKLLNEAIQPTAQRSRKPGLSQMQSPRPSLSINTANYGLPLDGNFSQGYSVPQGDTPMPTHLYPPPITGSHSPQRPWQPPQPEAQYRRPIKVGQVKQELKKKGLTYKPSLTSFSSIITKKQTTVRGIASEDDHLEELDKRLQDEFKDRDMVFLVDNGMTMSTWWTQATDLLEVLVWRALGYDDDGMELYFTNPDTNPKASIKESRKQSVKMFTKAMELAEPDEKGSLPCPTTILPELERIINTYTRAKTSRSKIQPRKMTIIVLTDGIWPGMHNEHTLDFYLRSAFHNLRDLHGDLTYIAPGQNHGRQDISEIKPVTIQFVQFGDDSKATERLRRLDDDMKYYGCPDLIDTEHAEGDIYKMFLGSLCRDIDHIMRYSLVPATSPGISPVPTMRNSAEEQNYIHRLISPRGNFAPSPIDPQSHQGFQAGSYINSQLDPRHTSFSSSQPQELPASPQEDPADIISPLSRRSTRMTTNSQSTASPWPAPLHPRGPRY